MREDLCRRYAPDMALRPIRGAADEAFLFQVYASTRLAELAALGWSEAQRETFIRMQFQARQQAYRQQFPSADSSIVLYHARPIGRLDLEERVDEVRGIDIALLPEYRNTGLGTAILQGLLAEAARRGKPFRLHVEKFNRAQRLYRRLGFTTLADDGVYLFMEWRQQAP
jgi:ribosomal protein S18 acetylase RimI-like enzyme